MSICYLSDTDAIPYHIYFALCIEYFLFAIALIYLVARSYRSVYLNQFEYRLYIILSIISAVIKIIMFINVCENEGQYYQLFIIAYELPYYSSICVVIYLWRVMQLKSKERLENIEISSRLKLELLLIISFNVLLYLFLLIYSCFVLFSAEPHDISLVARTFRGSVELVMAVAVTISALNLINIIRKLMSRIPSDLALWLTVGTFSCLVKCFEQFGLYVLETSENLGLWVYVLIFVLYNLTDILPTIVFLKSFKIYSNFISTNQESFESFTIMNERLQTIISQSCE